MGVIESLFVCSTPEKIEELKAASSAAGSEVAEIKKAQKEMDAEAKAANKPVLQAALEKLTAAKKAVEDAEKAVSSNLGLNTNVQKLHFHILPCPCPFVECIYNIFLRLRT